LGCVYHRKSWAIFSQTHLVTLPDHQFRVETLNFSQGLYISFQVPARRQLPGLRVPAPHPRPELRVPAPHPRPELRLPAPHPHLELRVPQDPAPQPDIRSIQVTESTRPTLIKTNLSQLNSTRKKRVEPNFSQTFSAFFGLFNLKCDQISNSFQLFSTFLYFLSCGYL
jgi:hypothetical protein